MSETTAPPGGLDERPALWHWDHLLSFTRYKMEVGEPSPHLAMVGHMAKDQPLPERVWRLGCYAATYCLPTAQMVWTHWPWPKALEDPEGFETWLAKNWRGIVTRRERRCVRSVLKMTRCLVGYARWSDKDFGNLANIQADTFEEYYDRVWDSVMGIPFIGRYIGIRLIEGLRRFCGVPAALYDIRSIGGWSPRKALMYLYPQCGDQLLVENAATNDYTDKLALGVLDWMRQILPAVDHYILAAMLCEYREAFEDHHQYPGWTIDQEPLLYDKVKAYWGDALNTELFWSTRKALFPAEALGECNSTWYPEGFRPAWYGTRWPLTKVLRDYGYNWSDLRMDYGSTAQSDSWEHPVARP